MVRGGVNASRHPSEEDRSMSTQISVVRTENPPRRKLSARLEPFDSYWQAPEDVESGYRSFAAYYRANYLPQLPADRNAHILVISCGPGYLVDVLIKAGYNNVRGIDSDPAKIEYAIKRGLPCEAAAAFPFVAGAEREYDVIIPEQELNHLTYDETIEFLRMAHRALRPGGRIILYAINSANPLVGSENRAQNIDHFYTVTEYSIAQLLSLGGFRNIKPFPLKLYVFWGNPLNYVGLALVTIIEALLRVMFKLYGKKVVILSKKIGAVAFREAS
jgi:2-polyprenyl-3-methyl-5-hydroxy-6-metoxy-1,4-benzoquinol methylase